MKKKIVIILIVVIIIVALIAFGIFFLVNSVKNHMNVLDLSNPTSNLSSPDNFIVENFSDGYAWINDGLDHYTLIDMNGKVIYELSELYTPQPVHEGFFVANLKSARYDSNQPITIVMDINGNAVFNSIISNSNLGSTNNYDTERFLNFGMLNSDTNFEWAVRTRQDIKDINGTTKKYKYYVLKNNEVIDYTDKVEITKEYKFDTTDEDLVRFDFGISDSEKNTSDTYILYNNGFFTIMKNKQQQFTPVEGKVEAFDQLDNSFKFIALVDGKHYIYNEDGSKQEISFINSNDKVTHLYDNVIAVVNSSGTTLMNITDGSKIEIQK